MQFSRGLKSGKNLRYLEFLCQNRWVSALSFEFSLSFCLEFWIFLEFLLSVWKNVQFWGKYLSFSMKMARFQCKKCFLHQNVAVFNITFNFYKQNLPQREVFSSKNLIEKPPVHWVFGKDLEFWKRAWVLPLEFFENAQKKPVLYQN